MKIKPLLLCAVYGLWLLSAAVFLAVAAYYLFNFAVEPLSRDQWHMYAQLFDEGLLTTSLSTVSGHRHLFAFTLFQWDWQWFAASNQLLHTCAWLLNALLLGLLVRVIWQEAAQRALLAATVVLIGCWLINLALLGWGFNGINNYLSIVPSVYGLYWLSQAVQLTRSRTLLLAAGCGLIASFSFGNGVVIWPAGVLLLWAMRAPLSLFAMWLAASALGLGLYLLLPGADAVNRSLLFNGWYTLCYPFEQLGGPLWHLVRSVPRIDMSSMLLLAKALGYVAGLISLGYLGWMILGRRLNSAKLAVISSALQLLGWGTLLLLTITRPAGMLDISIDRFQIWALLIWLGLLLGFWNLVAWRRVLLPIALAFPLLALPSQLDWGARLAEYNTRTTQGLLSWMIELPVAVDAERALHWNWQEKIAPMQQVLARAQNERKNLYRKLPPLAMGETVPVLAACDSDLLRLRTLPILAQELFVADQKINEVSAGVVGWRVFAEHKLHSDSRFALLNDSRAAVGFGLPIKHSILPRASGIRASGYNLYAVAKSAVQPVWLAVYDAAGSACELRLQPAD